MYKSKGHFVTVHVIKSYRGVEVLLNSFTKWS